MDKPIEIVRQELIEKIVELVNEAQLPAFAVADIFRNLTTQLDQAGAAQLEQARKAYEEQEAKKA